MTAKRAAVYFGPRIVRGSAAAQYEATELFSPGASDEDRWQDTLSEKTLDGKVLWGPIDLIEDGCSSIPYDLNPCLSRTHSDKPPPGWGSE